MLPIKLNNTHIPSINNFVREKVLFICSIIKIVITIFHKEVLYVIIVKSHSSCLRIIGSLPNMGRFHHTIRLQETTDKYTIVFYSPSRINMIILTIQLYEIPHMSGF